MNLPAGDPRHGTENGYCNHSCRCDVCREAWRVIYSERAWRLGYRKPRAPRGTNVTHGIISTYNTGCRCDDCRKAAALKRRSIRRRQGMRSVPSRQKYPEQAS